jgi:hypothetical protein
MTTDTTKNTPTLFAYVVEEYQSGKEIKSSWTRIGPAFTHDDGAGFTIRVKPGLAVSGRIVVRPPLPEQEEETAPPADTGETN